MQCATWFSGKTRGMVFVTIDFKWWQDVSSMDRTWWLEMMYWNYVNSGLCQGSVSRFSIFVKIIYPFLLLMPISWFSSDVKHCQYKRRFCTEQSWDLKTWPVGKGVVLNSIKRIVILQDDKLIKVSSEDQY